MRIGYLKRNAKFRKEKKFLKFGKQKMVEIWIGEKVEYRYRGKCTRTRRGEFTRTSSINFIGPLSITALVYSVDILNRLIWNDVKWLDDWKASILFERDIIDRIIWQTINKVLKTFPFRFLKTKASKFPYRASHWDWFECYARRSIGATLVEES